MSITIEMLAQRIEVLDKQVASLTTTNDAKEKKDKKEKKDNKKKDASEDDDGVAKKKRTSGYIVFSNAKRDEVKGGLAKNEDKPKNTEVMKELAKLWKALTDDERESWNVKAKNI